MRGSKSQSHLHSKNNSSYYNLTLYKGAPVNYDIKEGSMVQDPAISDDEEYQKIQGEADF